MQKYDIETNVYDFADLYVSENGRAYLVTEVNAVTKEKDEQIDRYKLKALDAEIKVCKVGEQTSALTAENQRLREALEDIAVLLSGNVVEDEIRQSLQIIRSALKQTEPGGSKEDIAHNPDGTMKDKWRGGN